MKWLKTWILVIITGLHDACRLIDNRRKNNCHSFSGHFSSSPFHPSTAINAVIIKTTDDGSSRFFFTMFRRFNSSSSTTGNANSFNMETELETNLNASLIVWSLNTNESETSSTSAGGLYLAGGILKPALLKNNRNELIVAFSIKFLLDLLGGLTNAALFIVCLHQRHGGSSGIKWLIIQYSAAYFAISFIFYPIRDAMILGSFFNLRVPGQEQCAHIATANTVCLSFEVPLSIYWESDPTKSFKVFPPR